MSLLMPPARASPDHDGGLMHSVRSRIETRKKPWGEKMKRLLLVVSLLAAVISVAPAFAADTSPYVVGTWRFQDSFSEGTSPVITTTTDNTDFVFVNPTDLTLTLEYAFFAADGTFCGCDRDTLKPNGRTRYTMLGELQGGLFSTKLCPTQTEGEMKAIVFLKEDKDADKIVIGDALQAGVQIHMFGGAADKRSESNLQGVGINRTTLREMNGIHKLCKTCCVK